MTVHDVGCHWGRMRDGVLHDEHSDAAKRLADTYMLHRVAADHAVGQWFAVKLEDGTGDGVLYPTKTKAVEYQRHYADEYCYIQVQPCGMNQCQAESMLHFQRQTYRAQKAARERSPDSQVIQPLTREQYYRQCADQSFQRPRLPIVIGRKTGKGQSR